MKRNLLIITLICMLSNVCLAAMPNNVILEKIEKQVFGCQFQNETEIKRLDRIEEYLYGTLSKGTATIRLKKINNDMGFTDTLAQKNSPTTQSRKETVPKVVYEKEDSTVSYPVVDKMESKVFNQMYSKENIYARVTRLEKEVYKKANTNDTLDARVNNLRLAILDKTTNQDIIGYSNDSNDSYDNSYKESNSNNNQDYEYNSPKKSKEDYFNMELTSLEKVILNDSYTTDSADSRLNRLEAKVFQRNFSNDDSSDRLQRISAAATAKKSSSQYDNNKLMKRLNTGAQIGTILLMILAMIL